MEEIIPFSQPYKFCVYQHKMVKPSELSTMRRIAIKNAEGLVVYFTGLEVFSAPYTGLLPKLGVSTKAELVYLCHALNDIFLNERVQSLAQITADMIIAHLNRVCNSPKQESDETYVSQQTLDKATKAVLCFFANLALAIPTSKIKPEDLFRVEYYKRYRQSTRLIKTYVPAYIPKRHHSYDRDLLRDMPLKAAERLAQLAAIHDPMIAFAVVAQLTTGLRPGEVMNLRQNSSPVSAVECIKISYAGNKVSKIQLDLTREFLLRSDGVSVGRIKKERSVDVFGVYIHEFYKAYCYHMEHLENCPCEADYRPMFVSKGKAMTYQTYVRRLRALVARYLQPELKISSDPLLAVYGHKLDNYNFTPHTLRHVFTVQLVLEGLDTAQIMYYRGDSSPESALTYLCQKKELEQRLVGTHTSIIDMLSEIGGEYYDNPR